MLTQDRIEALLKNKLVEDKFEVQIHAVIYNGIEGDVIAEKDGKKYLFEVKTSRDQIISSLIDYATLISFPTISFLYLAVPSELLQNDIVEIAKRNGIGLYKVSDDVVECVATSTEFQEGYLNCGPTGYPGSVFAGQVFEITYNIIPQGKIFLGVEVSYVPGGPFFVPEGKKDSKTFEQLLPGRASSVTLSVGVRENTKPGLYSLYVKAGQKDKLRIDRFDIEILKKNEPDVIKQFVLNSVRELNYSLTTNIESALKQIDEGIDSGVIDIKENITSYSIWNEIGSFCLTKGLFQQAELVYRKMLETIDRQEKRMQVPLHRGLAFYNLGLALYSQGKLNEAKESLQKAFEWDKRTYGEEKATDSLARKALDRLFTAKSPRGS